MVESIDNDMPKEDASWEDLILTEESFLSKYRDNKILKRYKDIKYKNIFDHENKRPVEAAVNGIKKIVKACNKNKKANIYICHVSGKDEIDVIKKYRKKGYKIIAEVTPHHLYFYFPKIMESNIYKVNPPIRQLEDVLEVRKQFNKGFFQVIGTDHAPHLLKEKESDNPPSGFPGLESAFYALYYLHEHNNLSLNKIFELLTSGYKIFKIKKRGELKKNNFADITIVKKEKNIFKAVETETKADFSPYDGLETNCKIDTVIVNGKIVLKNGEIQDTK
jgi:dihydroorotase